MSQGNHICLDKKIIYEEDIPTSGMHRPVWVTYGEYVFMVWLNIFNFDSNLNKLNWKFKPRERWIHAIEHGAAVFLYDPCASEIEIAKFKQLAKSCLRRHVITPSNSLGERFNVVTYGCRLRMSQITGYENEIITYLKVVSIMIQQAKVKFLK